MLKMRGPAQGLIFKLFRTSPFLPTLNSPGAIRVKYGRSSERIVKAEINTEVVQLSLWAELKAGV